ncbi:hypothetical protein CKO12_02930 [Chromatium okenii]|nr:hypothetical protein [Chromatium okenii]
MADSAKPTVEPNYTVRVYSITLSRNDPTDVYLPSIRTSQRNKFIDAFPLITLLQGANVDKAHYKTLARSLARRGFVVAVPNHAQTFPGMPVAGLFSDVHVVTDVLAEMKTEDGDSKSPLYRIVDTEHMGLIGHSFGGGIGLYALAKQCDPPICDATYERPSALRAAVFYGAHLVNADDTVTDLDTSDVAVALLQGTKDGVATPDEVSRTLPILELPQALISIEGANHYALCDTNNPTGASPDPSDPALDQADAIDAVSRWAELWLRPRLKGAVR